MLPDALAAMTEQLAVVGNASSLHRAGRAARRAVEESREKIAAPPRRRALRGRLHLRRHRVREPRRQGHLWARRDADPARVRLLVSAIEHHAVLDCVDFLVAHEGAKVTWLRVHARRARSPADASRGDRARTPSRSRSSSVMWANNEVGTVQDVASSSPWPRTSSACRCTPTRCRRPDTSPVDFAASAGPTCMSLTGAQARRPDRRRRARASRRDARLVAADRTAADRSARSASGTLDVAGHRRFAAAPSRRPRCSRPSPPGSSALRDRLIEGAMALGPDIRPTGAWRAR